MKMIAAMQGRSGTVRGAPPRAREGGGGSSGWMRCHSPLGSSLSASVVMSRDHPITRTQPGPLPDPRFRNVLLGLMATVGRAWPCAVVPGGRTRQRRAQFPGRHGRWASLTVGDDRRRMAGNVELGRLRCLSGMDGQPHRMPSPLFVTIDLSAGQVRPLGVAWRGRARCRHPSRDLDRWPIGCVRGLVGSHPVGVRMRTTMAVVTAPR